MSQNNVKLNEVKDFAFLADKSYKTANGKEGQLPKAKEGVITNPATKSSFEVVEQKNEYTAFGKGFGCSGTVFKNTETNEYVKIKSDDFDMHKRSTCKLIDGKYRYIYFEEPYILRSKDSKRFLLIRKLK